MTERTNKKPRFTRVVKARVRILDDAELRRLWHAAGDCGTFGALVKVLLLTAQRREKISTLRWDDLDADGCWTIRVAEREKGTAGKIALPKQTLAVITDQSRILGNPFVFAGRGNAAFNSFTQGKLRLDELSGVTDWTIHDLRRTARSLMARAGIRPDTAERVLGHTMRGVEGIYDRHGYDLEKADALKRLAQLIHSIVSSKARAA